jgi:hypothetical protein
VRWRRVALWIAALIALLTLLSHLPWTGRASFPAVWKSAIDAEPAGAGVRRCSLET